MMNITLTFIFNWHFGKTPLEEDISLSQRVESSYQIYIPMAQTYEVEIDFSKINKSAEVIESTFGTIIQPKTKSSQIRLLWEIEKDGEIVQSYATSTNESSAWSSKSITMRFGRFKVPAGSYNFTLKVLDSPEEYNDFETTLIILYNLNNAHTWQTYYMFFGMLFNMFVAPIIGGFILLRFLVG